MFQSRTNIRVFGWGLGGSLSSCILRNRSANSYMYQGTRTNVTLAPPTPFIHIFLELRFSFLIFVEWPILSKVKAGAIERAVLVWMNSPHLLSSIFHSSTGSVYCIMFSLIIYVITQCPSETGYIRSGTVDHFSNGWVSNRDQFGLENGEELFYKEVLRTRGKFNLGETFISLLTLQSGWILINYRDTIC